MNGIRAKKRREEDYESHQGYSFFIIVILRGAGALASEEKGILVVDRFSSGANEKGIPQGWAQEKDLGPQSKISVGQEKDIYFVHLLSVNDAFGIKEEFTFDIRKYPYLTWKWKATRLPKGGDIRKRETDDQAGQIYVLFPKFPAMANTRSMGYIWDTVTPVGTPGTSTAYSKMKYVVLQSGAEKLDQWIWETRNVYEDYKKSSKKTPPKQGEFFSTSIPNIPRARGRFFTETSFSPSNLQRI